MPVRRALTRQQLRALPYVDDHIKWRRLAVAALLLACTDAHQGDECAWEWLQGQQARAWADLVDLPDWPPTLDQLDSRSKLVQRRGKEKPYAEAGGPLRIVSRNPTDSRAAWGKAGRSKAAGPGHEAADLAPVAGPLVDFLARWELEPAQLD